jgi:hypothetical protein
VVAADAHRHAELLGAAHERREDLVDSRELGVVFGLRVLTHREPLLVGEVPGIDADLLDVLDRLHRDGGREVDVRDERRRDLHGPHGLPDVDQIVRIGLGGDGDAYDFAAGFDQARDLRDGRWGVGRGWGRHGLNTDRMVAPQRNVADVDDATPPPLICRKSGIESHPHPAPGIVGIVGQRVHARNREKTVVAGQQSTNIFGCTADRRCHGGTAMTRRQRFVSILIGVVGVSASSLALAGFLLKIRRNGLEVPAGSAAQAVYQSAGAAYSGGFVAGFSLCFFLALLAVAVGTWFENRRQPAVQTMESLRNSLVRRDPRG